MKAELGVCYYPEHWPEENWQDDARRMYDAGLRWVRIGEFAWSRLEPREGEFDWGWLDRAVEVLGTAGLKIVMGTPSATPPKWVVNKYPDMLAVDREGRVRKFGSRRHYCFSHLDYRNEAARMARSMAARYGGNPYILAWQIDNEYGCHDTTLSFSEAARRGFQNWLAQKYQSPDALNRAWGNVFWSMEYDNFDEIDLPNLTVTEANPSHWLDFRRFASSEVIAFHKAQVAAMRPYCAQPIIHNFMGRVSDFDHFGFGADLDIASWDSYPMGFLEQVMHEEGEAWKAAFCQQGDPDFQAFHHDLYRAAGKGRWWVMEQQPGPVNWAPYNPTPLDGMVALWSMEAVAHGAEVVSYFRWRQAPFAQEQMHAGLLNVDGRPAEGLSEAKAVFDELNALGALEQSEADVAIIFDYESQWAWEIQPQGQGFDYFYLVFEQYRALRQLGLNVDILPKSVTDFGARKLVLIPGLFSWNEGLKSAIAGFDGVIVAGPRTGSKTEDFQIPTDQSHNFAGVDVSRVASLRPNFTIELENGGCVTRWFESIDGVEVYEATVDGHAVMVKDGSKYYFGAWLDQNGYQRIFRRLCAEIGIATTQMPQGVRRRQLAQKTFISNYNAHQVEFEGAALPPASYIWRDR